ncbi:MAG: hypothetical protein DMG57_18240 [Acidobacteria bacterium]|nr:MAG: hypothetical protein DMG57_18240 [Acidobacteriota bacterium]
MPRQGLLNPRDGRGLGECFHGVGGFSNGFPYSIGIEPQGHVRAHCVSDSLDSRKIVGQPASDLQFDGVIALLFSLDRVGRHFLRRFLIDTPRQRDALAHASTEELENGNGVVASR